MRVVTTLSSRYCRNFAGGKQTSRSSSRASSSVFSSNIRNMALPGPSVEEPPYVGEASQRLGRGRDLLRAHKLTLLSIGPPPVGKRRLSCPCGSVSPRVRVNRGMRARIRDGRSRSQPAAHRYHVVLRG